MSQDDLEKTYAQARAERDEYTDAILQSPSRKKVVVAGPGTGKTTLFAKLLARQGGDTLTLSFINALIDDLALGLYGLSDVRTLHGFSAGVLKRETGARIYPKLSRVITEDARILLQKDGIDFDELFHQYKDDDPLLTFYKERKAYYGNYYGFADSIYAVAKFFEKNRHKIPQYEQIVVDEYQDFNLTEVMLIELLAENSPILIAGDDDQSLYIDLRDTSPDHIREKHGPVTAEYEAFSLPFCMRCTKVIVEAANDVVTNAKEQGLLKGRVSKPYRYFPSEKKDPVSAAHPKVIYTQQYEEEMALFIQKQLSKIAKHERDHFSVLVIVPPQMGRRLIAKFAKALKKRGFRNVSSPTRAVGNEPTLLEGLSLLLEDRKDNLGWRIVAKHLLAEDSFEEILQNCTRETDFSDHLNADIHEKVKRFIRVYKKVRDGKEVREEHFVEFLQALDRDPIQLAADAIREELLADETVQFAADRAIRGIPITLTTVPSSKGLSADYVFITHFDDQHFTQDDAVSDKDVYAFLVALTRAKKKCSLISSKDETPVLLSWINPERIDQQLDSPHRYQAAKRQAG